MLLSDSNTIGINKIDGKIRTITIQKTLKCENHIAQPTLQKV